MRGQQNQNLMLASWLCMTCTDAHLHDGQVGGRQVGGAADQTRQHRLQHVQHCLRVGARRQRLQP